MIYTRCAYFKKPILVTQFLYEEWVDMTVGLFTRCIIFRQSSLAHLGRQRGERSVKAGIMREGMCPRASWGGRRCGRGRWTQNSEFQSRLLNSGVAFGACPLHEAFPYPQTDN